MILIRPQLSKLSCSALRYFNTSCIKNSTYHVLLYDYVPNILEKRVPYRQDHLKHAMTLVDKGHLQLGGAWAEDEDKTSDDSTKNHLCLICGQGRVPIDDIIYCHTFGEDLINVLLKQ